MKKILHTTLILCGLGAILTNAALAFPETYSSNDHNMTILREQQFRFQEFDTNKDFQEKKKKKLLEDENYVKRVNEKKVIKSISQPKEFVEENGEIKIKGTN